jgi:hypothetical protein
VSLFRSPALVKADEEPPQHADGQALTRLRGWMEKIELDFGAFAC